MKRESTTSRAIVLTLVMATVLTGCAGSGSPRPTEAIKLAMGFTPNVQFTPFYVAVEKGYFAQEGIEIEFDYGWETDLLKLVGGGELQFAIGSGDQVILARSQGLPVVYVLNWYRRFPVCVLSLSETGIREPSDLIGRRVGTPATYGASYIGWRSLLDAAGIDESAVELVSIGYTQVAAISEGQVDAALCYAMNEPVQMQASGSDVDVIYVADYANLVSNGLFTNEQTVEENPELVQSMVRAVLRGIAFTIENPDEAFEISLAYIPQAGDDAATEAINRAVLEESIKFWEAEPAELGRSNPEDWQAAQRIMEKMGLVGEQDDVESMFTNEFIVEVEP